MGHDVKNFQTDVIEKSKQLPVLVDFWAPWCGPCRAMTPVMDSLAAKAEGKWAVAKVNVDENSDAASQYGVSSIPSVKLFINGKVSDEFVGAQPEKQVLKWLEENISAVKS